MIVSGERRWQAHRVAGLKTIQAVVKTYSTDGQFMVESLIENIHREDLSDVEKAKFLDKIMKEEKISEYKKLSERIGGISAKTIGALFDVANLRRNVGPTLSKKVSQSVIQETAGLPLEQRKELIKRAVEEDFGSRKMRELVRQVKQEPTPEPIQYEETINDYVDEALSNLHNFKYAVDKMKKANLPDLSKSKADKAITTAGLHLKQFIYFVNTLRQRGAKPDKTILSLIRANGKI